MKIQLGDYRIETDNMQYIIKAKKVIQAGRLTKEENVGKEKWEEVSYHSSLDSALKSLANKVVLDNDDIFIIKQKLNEIQRDIKGFIKALKGEK